MLQAVAPALPSSVGVFGLTVVFTRGCVLSFSLCVIAVETLGGPSPGLASMLGRSIVSSLSPLGVLASAFPCLWLPLASGASSKPLLRARLPLNAARLVRGDNIMFPNKTVRIPERPPIVTPLAPLVTLRCK